MKTKTAVSTKKQSVALKDLKTRKNPKGGAVGTFDDTDIVHQRSSSRGGVRATLKK